MVLYVELVAYIFFALEEIVVVNYKDVFPSLAVEARDEAEGFCCNYKRYKVGSGEWQCVSVRLLIIGRVYYMHIRAVDLKTADGFTGVIGNTGSRTVGTGSLWGVQILD